MKFVMNKNMHSHVYININSTPHMAPPPKLLPNTLPPHLNPTTGRPLPILTELLQPKHPVKATVLLPATMPLQPIPGTALPWPNMHLLLVREGRETSSIEMAETGSNNELVGVTTGETTADVAITDATTIKVKVLLNFKKTLSLYAEPS